MADQQQSILDKVRKLIALAEGTKFEGEADTAWSKAQELMTKYAIDEAVLRSSGKQSQARDAVVRRIPHAKSYKKRTMMALLNVVCQNTRCQLINTHAAMVIIGMESDVNFTEMLWTSLQLEGWRWMLNGMQTKEEYISREVFERSWWDAFINRVHVRMSEANRKIQQEAEVSTPGVSIVLKGTGEIVSAKVAELFPRLTQGRASRARSYSSAGAQSGTAAGNRADLTGGTNRMRGQKAPRLGA